MLFLQANLQRYINDALITFKHCLTDEKSIITAFMTRESLGKNGSKFPTIDTSLTELNIALEAIDKDDHSIYTYDLRLCENALGLPQSVYSLMNKSEILRYDSAMMESLVKFYQESAEIIQKFPDDAEEILLECNDIKQLIINAISDKILQLEYTRTIRAITDNPSIPLEIQEYYLSLLEQKLPTSVDLAKRIIAIKAEISEKMIDTERKYEEAKVKLKYFLENTPKFKSLKEEGRKLLEDLNFAEARQDNKSLIFLPATDLINKFLSTAESKLKTRFESYNNRLIYLLKVEAIGESFKEEGKKLFTQYAKAIKENATIYEIISLAFKIKEECENIVNNFRNHRYSIANEALTGLINNLWIPSNLKNRGNELLKDENVNEELILAIKAEIESINFKAGEIESQCNDKKRKLELLLINEKIDPSFKANGHELIAAYKTIITEKKSLMALIEHANLLEKESIIIVIKDKKNQLQLLVDNDKISETFKAHGIEILKQELFTEKFIEVLEREINYINNKVQTEILRDYLGIKLALQNTIAIEGIPEDLKVDAGKLISRADIFFKISPLDLNNGLELIIDLKEGIQALNLKIDAWRLEQRYIKASDIMLMNIKNPRIPGSLKNEAIELKQNTNITIELVIALEANNLFVETEIKKIQKECSANINILERTLADNQIDEKCKVEGRKLLAEFKDKEKKAEHWEPLGQFAHRLILENNIITKRIAFLPLRNNLEKMEKYGNSLSFYSSKRGEILTLTRDLQLKISGFIESSKTNDPTEVKFKLFKDEFTQLLHSKDDAMGKHRIILKPIIANILIALSGVGLIAMVLNAGFQIGSALINNKKISLNNSFFFAKTNSEQNIDEVEAQLNKL